MNTVQREDDYEPTHVTIDINNFLSLSQLLITGCMTLHHQSYELLQDYTLIIITGTLAGYLIIFIGYFASVMQGEPIPKAAVSNIN
jgi:hypothetical protein